MEGGDKIIVLDTSGWLPYYGLGNPDKVLIIHTIVDSLKSYGYRLGYTSVTLYEVKRSPRPEIRARYKEVLHFIRTQGAYVGPSYAHLMELASFVPEDKRHDAAIAIATGPHTLLTLDMW